MNALRQSLPPAAIRELRSLPDDVRAHLSLKLSEVMRRLQFAGGECEGGRDGGRKQRTREHIEAAEADIEAILLEVEAPTPLIEAASG